jgi:hypothetical protein
MPVVDFELDMVNVTQEQIEHLMIEDDEPQRPSRPKTPKPRASEKFGFTDSDINPFD